MSNAHRLDGNEQLVGEDESEFPTGVNHIEPHRVPPGPQVIKHVPGPFVPYVGQGASVFHGVPPGEGSFHNDPYEAAEYQATMAPDVQVLPELVTPIPVIVVPPDSGPEVFHDWRTVNQIVGPDVLEIIGKDTHRSRMLVRNENTAAADTIRIASRRGEALSSGYLVPAGVEVEVNAQNALYAVSTTATIVRLSVLCEFSVNG